MRIVHAANASYNAHGQAFANPDQKIQHGLLENGHFSYFFPVNDIARQMSWRNSKNGGKKPMNESFVETCLKVQPNLLVLGHGQLIERSSVEKVKEALPQLKIIQWFVDPMVYPHVYQFIFDRHDLLDAVFLTTGGEKLEQFRTASCQAHYMPNPVHPDLERYKAFEEAEHEYDLIFVGNDRKDPSRRALLKQLDSELSDKFKIGIFGSLGRPGIHGKERDELFRKSKAALNLTRHEPLKWYTSDRIAQIMGNGLLACTRAEADLHEIYGEESLLTYKSTEELVDKLGEAFTSGSWKETARRGWEKTHEEHSCKLVAQQLIAVL